MTTEHIPGVTLATKANVYFDGKCVSHSFTLPDGTKKSVGVVLPATLTFGTAAAEIMECVAGACEYKLDGSDGRLVVPLNESNPALGFLDPPHHPGDRSPRLDVRFGVDEDRWLVATVIDLKTQRTLMNAEPVVRLL